MRSGSKNAKYLRELRERQYVSDEAIGTEMIRRFRIWMNRLEKWYDENQPRAPAGTHEGGQWIDAGSHISRSASNSNSRNSNADNYQVAGGFKPKDLDMTVQQFISSNCKGSIHREIPGQFYEHTIRELMEESGWAANKCIKILMQDRFRK